MNKVFDPTSTYRLQLHKDFTLHQLEAIIPYLSALGIRTVYASPIFEAAPGSLHGYDGVNPNRINPEIGTEEELVRIASLLKEKGIHWIQDIVPNHLSFHENNAWLMDVLAHGRQSQFANYFDIDWEHPDFDGKLMVPFPGSPLEEKLKKELPAAAHYVITHWTETDKRIDYRRFFTVNSLICTNIQYRQVFDLFHALIGKLVTQNVFQGLRVDHIDGLYNPPGYLADLRNLAGDDTYIVVEKILEPGEALPTDWPVQGSSGYDFLGMVNNLLTYNGAEYALTAHYYDITRDSTPVSKQILEKKSHILFEHMNGELDNLVRLYKQCGLNSQQEEDGKLKERIAQYLISCPVYRYYGDGFGVMKEDKGKNTDVQRPFYTRCMQFTGPLMAKGVEDTLMYTYNRFIGHNEVGDSPEFFGYSAGDFHRLMIDRQRQWPLSLNGSSTHDTKRGEDARARLHALTGLYEEWMPLSNKWFEENTALKNNGAPDANDEYLIYQTLVATHPYPLSSAQHETADYPARLKEYLHKALREAKLHSSWSSPNEAYENACVGFANRLLDPQHDFWKTFEPFLKKVADYGMINSFAQLVLKFFCPGVPDVYQGTELWDLSLVDPDNRRPVDYQLRADMLGKNSPISDLWASRETGEIKLKLLQLLLRARNQHAEWLSSGEYLPLEVSGKYSAHVLAFLRRQDSHMLLLAVPLNTALMHHRYSDRSEATWCWDWEDTMIALPAGGEGQWKDLLHERSLPLTQAVPANEIFRGFFVAVLAR